VLLISTTRLNRDRQDGAADQIARRRGANPVAVFGYRKPAGSDHGESHNGDGIYARATRSRVSITTEAVGAIFPVISRRHVQASTIRSSRRSKSRTSRIKTNGPRAVWSARSSICASTFTHERPGIRFQTDTVLNGLVAQLASVFAPDDATSGENTKPTRIGLHLSPQGDLGRENAMWVF
jgi:hypothetical protein